MEEDVEARRLKHWEEQDAIVVERRKEAYNIGGEKQIKRLAKQGKKTMRELIRMLIDPGSEFFELGLDAGYNIGDIKLYGGDVYLSENRGHIPGGGVITGVGTVQGKDCMIFANENRYCGRDLFPHYAEKTHAGSGDCRAPSIALHLHRRFGWNKPSAAVRLFCGRRSLWQHVL